MSKSVAYLAILMIGLTAAPVAAGVEISCYRGPIPQSPLINGARKSFITSIHKTYDVTMEEAKAIAQSVCSDMAAVRDPSRLVEMTKVRVAGLKLR